MPPLASSASSVSLASQAAAAVAEVVVAEDAAAGIKEKGDLAVLPLWRYALRIFMLFKNSNAVIPAFGIRAVSFSVLKSNHTKRMGIFRPPVT